MEVAAGGVLLALVGVMARRRADGSPPPIGARLGEIGGAAAALAGDLAAGSGRLAGSLSGAGIAVAGNTMARSAGLVLDGSLGLASVAGRVAGAVVAPLRPPRDARTTRHHPV